MNTTLLDNYLSTLSSPLTIQERLRILEAAVRYWHGEPEPGDAQVIDTPLLSGLPLALKWAYEHDSVRRKIFSGQNQLLPPNRLETDAEGRVLFYVENQWVNVWATEFGPEDPPVWGRLNVDGKPWELDETSLATFLTKVVLVESIFGATFGASAASVSEKTLDRISEFVPPLPGNAWHWPKFPTRLHARGGAIMLATPNGIIHGKQGYSVFLGAIAPEPLTFLKDIVDDRWEHVEIE